MILSFKGQAFQEDIITVCKHYTKKVLLEGSGHLYASDILSLNKKIPLSVEMRLPDIKLDTTTKMIFLLP
jgi:hypothetical protein